MQHTSLTLLEHSIKIVSTKHDPQAFFKKRKGLYVWDSFADNILPHAKTTKKGAMFDVASFELPEDMTDAQIEAALPKEHIFSETDVCAIVAHLIEAQPNGEEGPLLTNGYANLFYTPSRVVDAYWLGGVGVVLGWSRDGDGWGRGRRVFSPATGARTSDLGTGDSSLELEKAVEVVKAAGFRVFKEI